MTEKRHRLTKQMLLTFDVEVHWRKLIIFPRQKYFCFTAVQLVIILKTSALVSSQELAIKECGVPAFSCISYFYIRIPKADS
jgi:hypothetical protein